MMSKARILFVLGAAGLVLGSSARAAAGQETLTLDDVVREVLARNPSVKEAEETIAGFEARVAESRSRLLPQVRGGLSYSRIFPLQEITIPGLGTFQLYPADNYDTHAGASQLVYDFKKTKTSVDVSRSMVASAEDQLALLRRDLRVQTAVVFDGVLFLERSLLAQDEHITTLGGHLEAAEKLLAAGTATELDVLNTKVRIAAARSQRVDLANALDREVLGLRRLMGREDAAPLRFEGEFARRETALEAGAPEALVEEAFAQRPETLALENLLKTADLQVRLAELFDRPSLSVNVLAGVKNGFIPNLNTWKFNYVAAVQADVPIFDGSLGKAMKAESEANLRGLQSRRKEVEDMVRTEVLQALADVRASSVKLDLVEANVVQAARALQYARTRYEAGTTTSLDLQDAEDARTQAEFTRLRALYEFTLGRVALDRAVGRRAID
jgi:outer membrane protein